MKVVNCFNSTFWMRRVVKQVTIKLRNLQYTFSKLSSLTETRGKLPYSGPTPFRGGLIAHIIPGMFSKVICIAGKCRVLMLIKWNMLGNSIITFYSLQSFECVYIHLKSRQYIKQHTCN